MVSDLPERQPQESGAEAEGPLHTEGHLTLTQIPLHQDHQLGSGGSGGSGTGSADEEAVVRQRELPGSDCAYLRSILRWSLIRLATYSSNGSGKNILCITPTFCKFVTVLKILKE